MDLEQAAQTLDRELQAYQEKSYVELATMVGSLAAYELDGGSPGRPLQIEIEVVWDAEPGGNIRVMGAIDDGGWSSLRPLTRDFVLTPMGESL